MGEAVPKRVRRKLLSELAKTQIGRIGLFVRFAVPEKRLRTTTDTKVHKGKALKLSARRYS
jgi:hypothetical protein